VWVRGVAEVPHLPHVVELPIQDAHGPRLRVVLQPAPVRDGGFVRHGLLDLRQVRPPPEAPAQMASIHSVVVRRAISECTGERLLPQLTTDNKFIIGKHWRRDAHWMSAIATG
jgi:hypothetical protein